MRTMLEQGLHRLLDLAGLESQVQTRKESASALVVRIPSPPLPTILASFDGSGASVALNYGLNIGYYSVFDIHIVFDYSISFGY